MTTNTATRTASPATERAIAIATTTAPLATGLVAPWLDGGAAFTAALTYGGTAGFLAANYMNRLPDTLVHQLPAGDIVRAHRSPLFMSTLTTGMALGMGTLMGPEGTDALMAGILTLPSIPGIVSLGWWAAVALVPWKLRNVLRRTRPPAPADAPPTAAGTTPAPGFAPILGPTGQILHQWAAHISHPATGTHRGQELTLTALDTRRWTGTITAPTGNSVTVNPATVSSVYQIPATWIRITDGAHAGERHITVNLTAPAEIDPTTLAGAWSKYVARSGGVMPNTHLEDIQDDPNTGGTVARVVADENLDKLTVPDRAALAGALRTTPLLVSYEPRQDPREAIVRTMDSNPLETGTAFPGPHVLKANPNGYIQIGRGISGFPSRIQIHDPNLGGQHVLVAGVTGSGKGGTLQIIALAHHINASAIIYADPKGSSNPAIEKMAAYSGLGPHDAMGALRIWWHLLQHRIAESARLGLKNFKAGPDRPWAPLILDEASSLLSGSSEYKKEAVHIVKDGARLGRSLGMPVILANQIMQLDQLGGEAAIRDNIFYGGSLVLLRSDSSQKHLVDLPDAFAGCNPADIPASWTQDRAMVYNPDTPDNDPDRTFGLGFAAAPGATAEMMRAWVLEDATPHINPDIIAHPADFPLWDQRHELAATSVLGDDEDDGVDSDSGGGLFTMPVVPKKTASADDKILAALREAADPLGIDPNYLHKDQIGAITRLEPSTLDNTLSKLVKAGTIHRQTKDGKVVRGWYGLGPAPEAGE